MVHRPLQHTLESYSGRWIKEQPSKVPFTELQKSCVPALGHQRAIEQVRLVETFKII